MCETEQSYDAFKWQSENVKEVSFLKIWAFKYLLSNAKRYERVKFPFKKHINVCMHSCILPLASWMCLLD